MREPNNDMRVGVAWYDEAEWQRLRDVAADPGTLEPTYAEWLEVFEKSLRDLAAGGVVAERVDVRVAELQQWCEQEGHRLDGSARSDFAAELLRRRYQNMGDTSGA